MLRRPVKVEGSLAEISGQLDFGDTKTHAVRSVPLSPSLMKALERRLDEIATDPDALVFTSPNGKPVRYRNFLARVWHPALARVDIPMVGVHVLRHSAAARMISAGASPKAVQEVLGHRTIAFSLTVYGLLFDADLDDLGARLDVSRVQGVSRIEDRQRATR